MKHSLIIEIISILLMILFLYTGVSKLTDYNVFEEQLTEIPIFSSAAPFIALALPILEIIIVVMLLIPKWRIIGLYSSLCLMIVFTIYVVALVSFNENMPCSCGGIMEELTWPQHIIFNIVFTILAGLSIKLYRLSMNNNISVTTPIL